MGGESGHTLQRVVDFCEGWFPRGRAPEVIILRARRPQGARGQEGARHEDDLGVGMSAPAPRRPASKQLAQAGVTRANHSPAV